MIKKCLLIILLFVVNIFSFYIIDWVFAAWDKDTIQEALIWASESNIVWTNASDDDWLNMLAWIFVWIKETLTKFILLIVVWSFLFIWVRLALARWNPEEFKKGMMQLVYAIIWLFLVSIAWAAVVLVSWLTI